MRFQSGMLCNPSYGMNLFILSSTKPNALNAARTPITMTSAHTRNFFLFAFSAALIFRAVLLSASFASSSCSSRLFCSLSENRYTTTAVAMTRNKYSIPAYP